MQYVERELARLLVELTFTAARQRMHQEASVLMNALEYLIADREDLQISRAYVHLKLDALAEAKSCLGDRNDAAARLVAQWITDKQHAAPSARLVR